jgi:prephenate dehydrogenase
MTVAVIGLGLIGGSICKAVKKYTDYLCLGYDINEDVLNSALDEKSIDMKIEDLKDLNIADLTVICLYPDDIITFARGNIKRFKKGSAVIDAGGIKTKICADLYDVFKDSGVDFIGAHPMAGREYSGYEYSQADLFANASFIVTPYSDTPSEKIDLVKSFALKIGFGGFVISAPQEHDRIIAYTSQLAHVVSNAYVKSEAVKNKSGFSAGSFKDLTRVAKLNEHMWSPLMMLNREFLAPEVKNIIDNLQQYLNALESRDTDKLRNLLKDGRILKEENQ